ncbi:MAG: OmpA family protein [Bacteroidetes bacterium]|nr:OmpA family protein [Bacteroidota bacterium]
MRFSFLLLLLSTSAFAQDEIANCPEVTDKKSIEYTKKGTDLKKYDKRERIQYLNKAIELEPENFEAYYALAREGIRTAEWEGTSLKPVEKYLLKIEELCPSYHPYVYFYLGSIYLGAEKYGLAVKYLHKFLTFETPPGFKEPKDYDLKYKRAEKMYPDAQFLSGLYENPVPFDPVPVEGICTNADEYLAIISPDDEIAFFTRKFEKQPIGELLPVMVEEFTCAERGKDKFTNVKPLERPFNQGNNYGGATVTIDNKFLFLTICNPISTGYNNCDIYVSEYQCFYPENSEKLKCIWSDPESLGDSVNTIDGWESQPSISSDGRTIYFSGARFDSKGMDIYVIRMDSLGNWSKAQRLPPPINTDGNEKSPFIHTDSRTLYFSSDGIKGVGGYDIFFARMDSSGNWEAPANIGYPINTDKDEVGFFVSTNGKTGFFASNNIKSKGYGGYDIFGFPLHEKARPQKVLFVKGEIKDESGSQLEKMKVEIKNLRTKETQTIRVDTTTGKYAAAITVRENEDFLMSVKKDGYSFSATYLQGNDTAIDRPKKVDVVIKPIEVGDVYRLKNINFETNSANVLTKVSMAILDNVVEFLRDNPGVKLEIHGHTDDVGSGESNLDLSLRRARAVNDYFILNDINERRLTFKGFGETKPVATNATEDGRAENRRTEFVVVDK